MRDGVYAIDAVASSGEFDPVLNVYRLVGTRVVSVASDDDGGEDSNSRILEQLDSTETYLVEVTEYNGRAGSVTLSVSQQ